MKRLNAIMILLLFQYSFSQTYLVLGDLEKSYQVKHYTLRPHSFYEGKEIEMYNVFHHVVFFG